MTIWTIGHSTHTEDRFLEIAKLAEIEMIMDVRSHPGSNRCPQFNRLNMVGWLGECGLTYFWEPGLGGWSADFMKYADPMAVRGVDVAAYSRGAFPKQRIGVERPAATDGPAWTNQGLYDYSWFTSIPEFHIALHRLVDMSEHYRVAIMCAEHLWWKCHRSMIADALMFMGEDVVHLQPKVAPHPLGDRIARYDPRIVQTWRKGKWSGSS